MNAYSSHSEHERKKKKRTAPLLFNSIVDLSINGILMRESSRTSMDYEKDAHYDFMENVCTVQSEMMPRMLVNESSMNAKKYFDRYFCQALGHSAVTNRPTKHYKG